MLGSRAMREEPVAAASRTVAARLVDCVIRLLFFLLCSVLAAAAAGYLRQTAALDPGSIRPWQHGHAYYAANLAAILRNPCGSSLICPMSGDTNAAAQSSPLALFEDGMPLGPAHALHVDIMNKGAGRYSDWAGSLIFSTSDNSDPRSNGRRYVAIDRPAAGRLVGILLFSLGGLVLLRQRRGADRGVPELRLLAAALAAVGGSGRSLYRASRLIGNRILPLGMTTGAICVIAYVLALTDQERGFFAPGAMIDYLIVKTQRDRAARVPAADIALVGDSSCLMGIDAAQLGAILSQRVESFCALAFLGPRGYAWLIDKLASRGAVPKTLILVFNPVQFARDRAADSWLPILQTGPTAPDASGIGWVLDYARRKWIDAAIYAPLPGNYALFYGGAGRVEEMLGTNHGSLVDPRGALDEPSLADFQLATANRATRYAPTPGNVVVDRAFRKALDTLAGAIRRLGAKHAYVVITPVADARYFGPIVADVAAAGRQITQALGLPQQSLLDTPAAMPAADFSTATHLNRWAREIYTDALAKELAAARSEARQRREPSGN